MTNHPPDKASAAIFDWYERGNRVINVSDHRDHLLTRRGGRSKTFSLSFPSIFPPCSSHRTEKGDSRSVCRPLTYPSLTSHHGDVSCDPMPANSLFYALSSNLRAIHGNCTSNHQSPKRINSLLFLEFISQRNNLFDNVCRDLSISLKSNFFTSFV